MTSYVVTGTQAAEADKNMVTVMKASDLHRTCYGGWIVACTTIGQNAHLLTVVTDDSSDSEEEAEDHLDDDAVLDFRTFKHPGAVNRIRVQPAACAISQLLASLTGPLSAVLPPATSNCVHMV
jgi:ribosome assembly protein RRB1